MLQLDRRRVWSDAIWKWDRRLAERDKRREGEVHNDDDDDDARSQGWRCLSIAQQTRRLDNRPRIDGRQKLSAGT